MVGLWFGDNSGPGPNKNAEASPKVAKVAIVVRNRPPQMPESIALGVVFPTFVFRVVSWRPLRPWRSVVLPSSASPAALATRRKATSGGGGLLPLGLFLLLQGPHLEIGAAALEQLAMRAALDDAP